MSRAEMRRQARKAEKEKKSLKLQMPVQVIPTVPIPKVVKMKGFTAEEISELTGISLQKLYNWCEEKEKEIRKEALKEAQQKFDKAEDIISMHNILYSLKSLEGFRYARAAMNYMISNYGRKSEIASRENPKEVYKYLNQIFGVEFEFDDPDINELLGFDIVDWRLDYIKEKIPVTIIDKISDDYSDIERAKCELATLLTLCEDFGFHKHLDSNSSKMRKFMKCFGEKYERLDSEEYTIKEAFETIVGKYHVDIDFTDRMKRTLETFGFI